MEVYYLFLILLIIIAFLLIFILIQYQKNSSRLSKDENMLLSMTEKCSFFVDEYYSLKKESIENNKAIKEKKYTGKTALVGDYFLPSYSNTKTVLEELGFSVDIAESSQYLINKFKYGEKYDIIFSNNIYKDGTSPECLKKLKEIKGFSTPVIIDTTTQNAKKHFVDDIGFDGYIEKPVTKEKLIPLLDKLFHINSI